MKILNLILAFIVVVGVSINPIEVKAENYSKQHVKVKKLFQSNEEKTTKDATWTAKGIFKVGVFNNGSDRSGYASYVCQVLYDYGFKGKKVWVQVIDIVKLTRNKKWVKLGEAHCQ